MNGLEVLKKGGKRAIIAKESSSSSVASRISALPNSDQEFCRHDGDASHVYGIVSLKQHSCLGIMSVMDDWDREQFAFWSNLLDDDLYDQIYRFEVVDVVRMRQPVPVTKLSDRRWRGLVTVMEELSSPTLAADLHDMASGRQPPNVCIRLPRYFCALVCTSAITSFLLPNITGSSSTSFSAWVFPKLVSRGRQSPSLNAISMRPVWPDLALLTRSAT